MTDNIEHYNGRKYGLHQLYEMVRDDDVITITELRKVIESLIREANEHIDNEIIEMYEQYKNRN